MQTSQVSNAANMLTSASTPNKQQDANPAAEPFGKVLSREVSQRNGASDAPRNKSTGNTTAGQQPAKTASKTSETPSAKEAKPADKAKPEEEASDAVATLPEEMLALVANLNEMNAQAVPAAEAAATQTAVAASDVQAALAAAVLPTTGTPADLKSAVQLTSATQTTAQTETPALLTAGLNGKADSADAQLTLTQTQLDAAVKVDELNLQAAPQSAAAKTQDFTSAMSESLNGVSATMQPVPQAALHALQQQAANATERLAPRVGTPAWDQALGQKVVWMVAGEQQSASLTLNPPDLGPLQVVLNVSNSQANATFIAAQPEVRQALEAALPKLREMLGEAGIQLGQASVNSGSPNQQGGFEQQGSASSRGQGRSGGRDTAGTDAQARVTRVQPTSSGLGMVDTFV